MFSRISGAIVERGESSVLLDVGGLAYEIVLPACVADKLPAALGERVTLEIHPTFNLEGNSGRFTFFGFTNAIEREFFEALISVASIGPKTAARAFALPMARIAAAIDAVTPEAIRRLAGRLLSPGLSAPAVLGPARALGAADRFHQALFG